MRGRFCFRFPCCSPPQQLSRGSRWIPVAAILHLRGGDGECKGWGLQRQVQGSTSQRAINFSQSSLSENKGKLHKTAENRLLEASYRLLTAPFQPQDNSDQPPPSSTAQPPKSIGFGGCAPYLARTAPRTPIAWDRAEKRKCQNQGEISSKT